MPYKANELRRHRILKAGYKVVNWAEYDAARQSDSLDDGRSYRGLNAGGDRAAGTAKGILDITIKVGLMLRLAFGRPWRQTEGMLGSIMDLLSLDLAVPDHTMFSGRSVGRGSATALRKTSARGNRQQRREGFQGRRVAA
jgi:hypothetical protein